MSQPATAEWRRRNRAKFASLSEFRTWERVRKAAWRAANPRKHKARLRQQKIYQRNRIARLRSLIFWEAIRRISEGTRVNKGTFAASTWPALQFAL